ncbi:hypothetical protein CW732_08460 [Olleya sp. Bg11-27]|nr:hypothetical protein CW732_08460 [Olleya sp. Bg11-27]
MKRSVQKDTNFSDKHRAEFLYFVFNFCLLKSQIKNLADFLNIHKPFGLALISYVLYTVL